ncbi:MAG: FtsX-like permease family protein, partial [Rhodospirillaceae bacterium]|nr:FtsX-like permease family protein [Rhodospirillaceae bacterium]
YRMYWRDDAVNGVGVYLNADADRASTLAGIRRVFGEAGTVRIQSNDLIRERSLAVFDQTFRITEVLRILAGLVAFLGLASALMSIELERAREVAILRSLGLRPRQTGVLTLTQTSLLGLAAGLWAMPLGLVMAALLIFVINVRSFGWSMELVVSARPLWLGLMLALGAALLAGIYPAVRAVNSGIAARLREE